MREELGDLLLQVVMHAQMAAERGEFSFEDVAREVNEKMIRRHPHVFGDAKVGDTAGVLRQWEEIKKQEKLEKREKQGENAETVLGQGAAASENPPKPAAGAALFKPTPPALTALLKARETWKTIRKKKLSVPVALADAAKITEFVESFGSADVAEERAGAALFALVAACREVGVDPESALRRHTARIIAAATAGDSEA